MTTQKQKILELKKKYEHMFIFWTKALSQQLEEKRDISHMFYVNPDIATANITNFRDFQRDLEELLK